MSRNQLARNGLIALASALAIIGIAWAAIVFGPGGQIPSSDAGSQPIHAIEDRALSEAERAEYLAALANHTATVYKSPTCTCCDAYVDLVRGAGTTVEVVVSDEMGALKEQLGVPLSASSCHTMTIGGYVVEGHVPLVAVGELIATRPEVDGIAVPGMPAGSPGMPGEPAPLPVLALVGGAATPLWDAR